MKANSMIRSSSWFLLSCLSLALTGTAWAEKADRDKDVEVSADHVTIDDLNQITLFTGHVVLVKGSMRLSGERVEQRQDERGYQHYFIVAQEGGLASFQERRDATQPGVESTVEGVGERVEYDDQSGKLVLVHRALVKRSDNGEQREMASGERIVYDSRHDTYEVDGRTADGQNGRVHLVIPPHRPVPDHKSEAGATTLKPATQLPGNTP